MKKKDLINHIENLRVQISQYIMDLEEVKYEEMFGKEKPDDIAIENARGRIAAYEECAKCLNNIVIAYYR